MSETPATPALTGELKDFGPLTVRPVRDDEEDSLWKRFVRAFHYLGFGKLFGHQIKYFAFLGHRRWPPCRFRLPRSNWLPGIDGSDGHPKRERRILHALSATVVF